MSLVRKLHRLRQASFSAETIDRLQAWIVFVGVPLMLIGVAALMLTVSSWISDAKMREQLRQERMNDAVERVIREVRDPQSGETGDTREETFDRIRQLCEAEPQCEP